VTLNRSGLDRRLPVAGSSDRWDRGLAGQIITEEFFGLEEAPPPEGGLLSVWSGSAWVLRPVLVWTGSTWAQKPAKRWSGTAWLLT
jgi:hypothetical protein